MTKFGSDEVTVVGAPAPGLPPSSRGTPCLIVLSGTNVGRVFPLRRAETLIGRHQDADVQLLDAGISRRHALVRRTEDGDFRLEDAGSRNGTFANNHRLNGQYRLHDGDKLQVGVMTILKFSYGDDLETKFAKKMYDAALRDDLTGAFNRRYLDDRLASEIAFATRHKTALAVLLLDIDHFKRINDSRGHVAGDSILRQLTERTTAIIRTEDVLTRYGGEEFCVLCRDTDLVNASVLAERIRYAIASRPFPLEQGLPLVASVSIGVAALPDAGVADGPELLAVADQALYEAKSRGRNCVVTKRSARGDAS